MQTTIIDSRRAKMGKGDGIIPMLSNGATAVADIPGFWTVAHCRSRHEKTLALVAEDSGFGYCLPLLTRRTSRPGHGTDTVCAPLPALDGYIFLASTGEVETGYPLSRDLHDFLEAQFSFFGIIEVRPSGQRQLVRELQAICKGIESKRITLGSSVVKGIKCEIVRGPYRGQIGVIDNTTKKGYAMLPITTLGQRVPYECDVNDLEPVEWDATDHLR